MPNVHSEVQQVNPSPAYPSHWRGMPDFSSSLCVAIAGADQCASPQSTTDRVETPKLEPMFRTIE